MIARSSWGAKADRRSAEKRNRQGGENHDLPFDDLLDTGFDEEGRLSQPSRGSRQRISERLDPRPAATSAEELDLAVQKLSQGLEAIERQGRGEPAVPRRSLRAQKTCRTGTFGLGEGRDFVTYSLDRLEARLEALSKRLQQRSGGGATPRSDPRDAHSVSA